MGFAKFLYQYEYIKLNGLLRDVMTESGMLFYLLCVAWVLFSYFFGSVNFALVLSKYVYHDDIRKYGSGNAGFTNMRRTFGTKAGVLTLLGDFGKTFVGVFVGMLLFGANTATLAGLACVLGHVYPVFYGFKGGKGVLCLATAVLMLSPIALALLLLVFILIVVFTKYVSLGSVVGALLYPLLLNRLFVFFFDYPLDGVQTLISMLLGVFIAFCHRENIKRLMRGEEHKFSFHSKKK